MRYEERIIMSKIIDRKVVLITRHTRLQELIQQYQTLAQAKFYIEHLGADFSDYLLENEAYAKSLRMIVEILQDFGRFQLVDRNLVPNYHFNPEDIVVILGQDGLVANTLKYLQGQPVIAVNPEPTRWDGLLLPFTAREIKAILNEVIKNKRTCKSISIAQANLSNGQVLRAVNDFFIGPKTHISALYEIEVDGGSELQSSSGIIVATGLGSTAWIKSIITGSMAIAKANDPTMEWKYKPMPWDSEQLLFAVREPFPSRSSQAERVYGMVSKQQPLKIRSRMAEHGVIFSDGMQNDFLAFNAGVEVVISLSSDQGQLII